MGLWAAGRHFLVGLEPIAKVGPSWFLITTAYTQDTIQIEVANEVADQGAGSQQAQAQGHLSTSQDLII